MKVIRGRGSFLLLLKMMHCVLEGENKKPDSVDHLVRAFSDS